MRVSIPALLCLSLLLAACGKAPENPAPASAASAATSTTAATSASTVPAASSIAAAATSEAATVSTTPAPEAVTTTGPEIAGSVALAQGSIADTAKDGSSRQLKDGDSVYPGDSFVLGPDSYLDLDLEDTGRILLRPNTTFQIQSYHYDADAHEPTDANGQPLIKPASAQPENAFFKLVKGGLRAVDGIIGKTNPQSYGVETPVATIGVRGTAFDVRYCGDDCADEADTGGKPDNGLYTSVSDGSIGVKNDSGETVTPAGHSSFVKSRKERAQALAAPPKALRHMDLPDKLKVRAQKNRGNIQVRRQKRRQMIRQRRQAEQKTKGAGKPGPGAKGAKPGTPAERRQGRREKSQEQRKGVTAPGSATHGKPERTKGRGAKREQQRTTPVHAEPGAAAGEGKSREQMKEKRQKRRDEHQQQAKPAATPDAQPAKGDEEKCKDKKKRRKNGKCDGG
jgi:hypothetical protein